MDYRKKTSDTDDPRKTGISGKIKLWPVLCILIAALFLIIYGMSAKRPISEKETSSADRVSAPETVEFKDPYLEEAVCRAMGISGRPIKLKEAGKIKSLDLSHEEGSRGLSHILHPEQQRHDQ